ncbi:hypothetical protein C0J52_20495 [Blattella germanica]|nr:hypothetical protein C0J52_20495 [Blattella germanica]
MAYFVTKRCVNCPTLMNQHVNSILKILQYLSYAYHRDAEAANAILQLLCGTFPSQFHVSVIHMKMKKKIQNQS